MTVLKTLRWGLVLAGLLLTSGAAYAQSNPQVHKLGESFQTWLDINSIDLNNCPIVKKDTNGCRYLSDFQHSKHGAIAKIKRELLWQYQVTTLSKGQMFVWTFGTIDTKSEARHILVNVEHTSNVSKKAKLINIAAAASTNVLVNKPRVNLQAKSFGNPLKLSKANRDQAMEMSSDLEMFCGVKINIKEEKSDYVILLNHLEQGWSRDNQFQIADGSGDLITGTSEGGSIAGGVVSACTIILEDWYQKQSGEFRGGSGTVSAVSGEPGTDGTIPSGGGDWSR